MTQESVEYEKIVQEVVNQLLKKEFSEYGITPKINRNVKIYNGTRERQVDVCWEIPIGIGRNQTTIVECKFYNKKVVASEIESLYGFISKSNNLSGIFVTTKGYQSGALEVCKKTGIIPLIIREPNEGEFTGIHTINIRLNNVSPMNIKSTFYTDLDSALELKSEDEYVMQIKHDKYNLNEYILNRVYDILPSVGQNRSCSFDICFEDAFISSSCLEEIIKVKKVTISFDININTTKIEYHFDNSIKYIFIDVLTNRKSIISPLGVLDISL